MSAPGPLAVGQALVKGVPAPPGGPSGPKEDISKFGSLTREPPEDLGRIGGIRSHLVSSKSVVIGPMFDPFAIGGKCLNFGRFGPPGPRDPLQRLGRIGGNRSPLFPSKSVVIGPILGQKTVWPMYALVYPDLGGGGSVPTANVPEHFSGKGEARGGSSPTAEHFPPSPRTPQKEMFGRPPPPPRPLPGGSREMFREMLLKG